MEREWAAYAPGAKDEVEAFAAGLNAYVAEVRAGTRPLPPEFKLTASQPEAWAPTDVIRILQDKTRLLAIMKDGQFHKAPKMSEQRRRLTA